MSPLPTPNPSASRGSSKKWLALVAIVVIGLATLAWQKNLFSTRGLKSCLLVDPVTGVCQDPVLDTTPVIGVVGTATPGLAACPTPDLAACPDGTIPSQTGVDANGCPTFQCPAANVAVVADPGLHNAPALTDPFTFTSGGQEFQCGTNVDGDIECTTIVASSGSHQATFTNPNDPDVESVAFDFTADERSLCGDGKVQYPNDDGIGEVCDGTAGVPADGIHSCNSACTAIESRANFMFKTTSFTTLLGKPFVLASAIDESKTVGSPTLVEFESAHGVISVGTVLGLSNEIPGARDVITFSQPEDVGPQIVTAKVTISGEKITSTFTIDVQAPVCNNHIKEGAEKCDDQDGINLATEKCAPDCNSILPLTSCGNGKVEKPNDKGMTEVCDGKDGVPEGKAFSCKSDCSAVQKKTFKLIKTQVCAAVTKLCIDVPAGTKPTLKVGDTLKQIFKSVIETL